MQIRRKFQIVSPNIKNLMIMYLGSPYVIKYQQLGISLTEAWRSKIITRLSNIKKLHLLQEYNHIQYILCLILRTPLEIEGKDKTIQEMRELKVSYSYNSLLILLCPDLLADNKTDNFLSFFLTSSRFLMKLLVAK